MTPSTSSRLPWSFLCLLVLALLLNIFLSGGFLLAIFIGWLLAEMVRPLHARVTKRWKHEGACATTVVIVSALAIVLPTITIPVFTIKKLSEQIKNVSSEGLPLDALSQKVWAIKPVRQFFDTPEDLTAWAKARQDEVVEKVPSLISLLLGSIPQLALQLTLALITVYFILIDGGAFAKWISPRIPLNREVKKRLSQSLPEIAVSSVQATMAAALAQALVLLIGFFALGVPGAWLGFGIAFLFAWFPLFGVGPVWAVAAFYLLATGHAGKAAVMVGIGIVASILDNVVRPWALRGKSDIHPLISLIVIFGNIEFFGILGVFTGPVLVKLLIECLEVWPSIAPDLGLQEK